MENSNPKIEGDQDPNEKLGEFKVDEVREKLITDLGLDETDQSELIDKLVADKLEEHKKFTTAIGQKINWRNKFQDLEKNNLPKPDPKPQPVQEIKFDENKIVEVLEKRDLEALDLSDELKKEVSTYAKVQGITVKKALNSEYITFLKEKEEKKDKIDNASLGAGRKPTKKDYGNMKASDLDLRTPEGKADFAKYEEDLKKKLG